jgi:hypothetical protein
MSCNGKTLESRDGKFYIDGINIETGKVSGFKRHLCLAYFWLGFSLGFVFCMWTSVK